MSFDTETTNSRVRITAHAYDRMAEQDRNFTEEEVLEAVRNGRRYERGRVYHAVLGRVKAVIVDDGDTQIVVTVLNNSR
jgi:hypothetical protein